MKKGMSAVRGAVLPLLLLLCSFSAGGETLAEENLRLREELLKQQRETERLSAALAAREKELRKLRIWLALVQADGKTTAVSEREERLLGNLKVLADSAGELALKSMDFGELLRPKLNALPLSSAERVRLVMALEALERSAARVSAVAGTAPRESDEMLRQVRVVAVRPDLNMAVIAAGALHGVFPGMTFVTPDGKIKLRVAETRPFVSGVVPVAGSLNTLVPGGRVMLQITRAPAEKKRLVP